MAVIARVSTQAQDLFRENGAVAYITETICNDSDEMKRWAAHALFWLVCSNTKNQQEAIMNPELIVGSLWYYLHSFRLLRPHYVLWRKARHGNI